MNKTEKSTISSEQHCKIVKDTWISELTNRGYRVDDIPELKRIVVRQCIARPNEGKQHSKILIEESFSDNIPVHITVSSSVGGSSEKTIPIETPEHEEDIRDAAKRWVAEYMRKIEDEK